MRLFVLLSLLATATLGKITQSDLRSIFTHHQEYCREKHARIGVGGIERKHRTTHSSSVCQQSLDHEWHINTEETLDEEVFQAQLQHRRRQLIESPTPIGHVYLARVAPSFMVTSELREQIESTTDVTFDEYLTPVNSNEKREYFLLYSESMDELSLLEKEEAIDEIIPFPNDWKLSPLLKADDGFDEDNLHDFKINQQKTDDLKSISITKTKSLQLKISPRSKELLRKRSNTKSSMKEMAVTMREKLLAHEGSNQWPEILVESAGAEASSHFDTIQLANHHEEESEWMMIYNIPSRMRATVAQIVSEFPEVLRIEPVLMHTTSNAWARWVTQSYIGASTSTTKDITTLQRATIWNRDIKGQGQVVGVGDSGLAHKNCLFNEPGKNIQVTKGATYNDATHRKVIQYVAFADAGAGEDKDHGTHVSGSVAGHAVMGGTLGDYDGMAPLAKLAFFDIGEAGARGLSVPNDLARNMFPLAYQVGARLHTNSWGSNQATYTSTARSCDQFMWDNQDFLVLVASGNSGGNGAGSIGSPATGKSVLSVGASLGTASSFEQDNRNPQQICDVQGEPCTDSMASFSSLGPLPNDQRMKPELSAPGALTWSALSNTADQYTCPTQQNQELTPAQLQTLVFPTQGTSMATPTTAGNAALVRQYFVDGWYPRGVKTESDGFNPLGATVKAILMNSAKPMNGEHGNQNLGGKTAANGAAQDGARRSTPTYSQRNLAGQGLTILDRTLFFADNNQGNAANTPANHDLFVVGSANTADIAACSLKTGESKKYMFSVNPGAPFKVTLVWSDAPGSTAAAKALVNNLDLEVRESGQNAQGGTQGTKFIVNGFENSLKDDINPFEQVEVWQPTQQWYEVTVIGRQVTTAHKDTGGQPFSLVVTGKFAKTAELYPGATPVVTANAGQKVIIGKKNRWVILGQQFDPIAANNLAILTCQGQQIQGVTVTAATTTSITVETTTTTWTCPGKVILGVITTVSGFESAQSQVGSAITEAEAGNLIVGADGVVQVAPTTQAEKDATCQGFSNTVTGATDCVKIEFCQYDEKTGTCSGKPTISIIVIVIIIIVVILLIGGAYYCMNRGGGGGGRGGNAEMKNVNLPTAAGIPGPPPKKPSSGEKPLKPGWLPQIDPGSGDTYYFNKDTQATTWERHLIEA